MVFGGLGYVPNNIHMDSLLQHLEHQNFYRSMRSHAHSAFFSLTLKFQLNCSGKFSNISL